MENAPVDKGPATTGGLPELPPDWSGWRGPQRDGRVPWLPARLPEKLVTRWKARMADQGVGGVAATRDAVLVTDREFDDTRDVVRCLDAATGKPRWTKSYAAPGKLDYGNSARATPLVVGELVIVMGAHGHLHAYDLATGAVRWKKDLAREFDLREEMKWGLCASPLLVDGLLVVCPGGEKGCLAALEPATGEVRWRSPGGPTGHGSPIVGLFGGRRQILGHDKETLGGWDPATGARLWSVRPDQPGDFNVPTPLLWKDRLVVATEGNGLRLFDGGTDGSAKVPAAALNRRIKPDTHTPVIVGDRLFAAHRELVCIHLADGLKPLWSGRDEAYRDHASLIASTDRVLVQTSTTELILVDALADEYKELGRLRVLDDEDGLLAHPALVGRWLYVRGAASVVCVDLLGEGE